MSERRDDTTEADEPSGDVPEPKPGKHIRTRNGTHTKKR